jgi:glucose dehydrogenase
VIKKNPVLICWLLLLVFGGAFSAQVRTPDQLLINPDPKDWLTYGGSYNSQRYSLLKQVTAANASHLQTKWVYHVDGMTGLEPVPIVMDGVMYISGFNRVDAIDARSGNVIWKYQRQPASATRQRGTAVYGDKVYVITADGHIVALDRRTGGVRWDVRSQAPYEISGGAPIVADGKLIVSGNRPGGFVQAYDAETGKYIWTWSALPKPEKRHLCPASGSTSCRREHRRCTAGTSRSETITRK